MAERKRRFDDKNPEEYPTSITEYPPGHPLAGQTIPRSGMLGVETIRAMEEEMREKTEDRRNVTPMPLDPEMTRSATRQAEARRRQRRGRSSTMLSGADEDKLGG